VSSFFVSSSERRVQLRNDAPNALAVDFSGSRIISKLQRLVELSRYAADFISA
jgi:hypothetical protein